MAVSTVVTSRPTFEIGQEIEVGEDRIRGEVLEVTTRSLVLGLKDGSHLHVPHADLLESPVRVFTTGKPRRSSLEVSIPFSVDVDQAERVILEALGDSEAVLADPPLEVIVEGYDAGVRLSVRFWHGDTMSESTRATDQAGRAIRRALSHSGIGTAVPALEVRVEPGSGSGAS
jgi:small-conductance mechanosensitive channel